MEVVPVRIHPRSFGESERRDWWWTEAILVVLVFGGFIVYTTWAGIQNEHYTFGPYLSPFYSPELYGASPHAWFGGPQPPWWPAVLPYSPAFLILAFPALFRFTCYYYRGAYYKAFWADPVSCAVGEPRGTSYWGERWFPLVLQNVHRYFAYAALIIMAILAYDVYLATRWPAEDGRGTQFGIGVGTILMLVNVLLIAAYTLGCHSLRHLFGGGRDEISKAPISQACYNCSSALNRRHMPYAWLSLFSVGLTDAYIRLCSMGVLTDYRIF